MLERKVGEIFKVNGRAYVVVPDPSELLGCPLCAVRQACPKDGGFLKLFGECAGWKRNDRVEVHFEEYGVKW